MIYYLLTTVSDNDGFNTVIIVAPTPKTTTKPNNLAKRRRGNNADGTNQPASGQHPNCIRNATTGWRVRGIVAWSVLYFLALYLRRRCAYIT